ncbi:MAG: T9SS type A sorting domain-containing protein [Bacteroidota bacterium]
MSTKQFVLRGSLLLFLNGALLLPAQSGTCTSTKSNFPSHAHFETGFNTWENVTYDGFDWIRTTDSTPTGGTGPTGAFVGNYYAYVEASGHLNQEALLEGPCFDFTGYDSTYLGFRYHVAGVNFGFLAVEAIEEGATDWDLLWVFLGASSDRWRYKRIELTDYEGKKFKIRFRAKIFNDDRSDIGLDGIYVYGASGSGKMENSADLLSASAPRAYPIPAHEAVQIEWEQTRNTEAVLRLRDLQGRVVRELRPVTHAGQNRLSLPTATLPSGTYLLQTILDGRNSIQKLNIQHF